jgi:anti-sigma regulatory factor (Ser/Thr protein kinase)
MQGKDLDGPAASGAGGTDARAIDSLRSLADRPGATRSVNTVLDREPTAPGRARAEVREALAGRLEEEDIGTVVLLTSELVTNAVIHPTAPRDSTIGLRISVRANGVRVEVDDQGDGFDPSAPAVATGRGGRGLFLVDRCAASWGARRTEPECGNRFRVWFDFASDQREPALVRGSAGPSPA